MIGDDVRLLARGWESEAASSAAASLTGDDSYRLAGGQRQETARLGLRRHSHCLSLPWFPFSLLPSSHSRAGGPGPGGKS